MVTMLHLDTQIVSYAINGTRELPASDIAISSTTAQELLLMQGSSSTRNNYYVPMLAIDPGDTASISNYVRHARSVGRFRDIAGQRSTDRMILDFWLDYPKIVEYSHHALADALNAGNYRLLEGMARALKPMQHKAVIRRLRFLLDHGVQCVPLGRMSAEAGLRLFHEFASHFALKSNFRNSVNDILNLAVAQTAAARLHTDDQLLANFAASLLSAPVDHRDERITIDFTSVSPAVRHNREAKGYVNLGWRVHSHNVRKS
jgi:hypothetical protein